MTTALAVPPELMMSKADEAATLGSMVLDAKVIPAVLERVTRDSFAYPEHQVMFDTIVSVWTRNPGGAIDGVLLRSELEQTQVLKDVGGLDYLKQVVESVPTAANAKHYAERVAQRQRYRTALAAVENMTAALLAGGDADEVTEQIQNLALGLQCRPREQNIFHVADHVTAVAVETQDEPNLIPIGYQNVDHLAGGVCPGELVFLAARPSIGKTAFACGWAVNAAKAGKRVVYFTLEMTARVLMERMVALVSQIPLAAIKRRKAPQDMLDSFYEGALLTAKLPITIVENIPTAAQILAVIRQLKQARPVDVVFIDYIGLMSTSHSYRSNRNEQLTEISRDLKLTAQSEHVPVVAVAQLNRECEGRDKHRPRMSDLRDSGSQEQDADLVLLLHREDYYRKLADPATTNLDGLAEVIVAKARNGPTGVAQMVFIEEQMRFADLTRDEAPE